MSNEMITQYQKYEKYRDIMAMIGVTEVTTNRQRNNGTRAYRLPFKDAYGYDIDFATYSSGYVRKIMKYGYCPVYQINQVRKVDTGFVKIKEGPYAGLYRKRYDHSKRILIDGIGDRIEYLFNFILRNYFVAKPKYVPKLNMDTLNRVAKYVFDERNFDLCDKHTQNAIIKRCQD